MGFEIRRYPAAGVHIPPNGDAVVLVRVGSRERRRWLACDEVHQALVEAWKSATAWRTGKYVVMPDHIHFFAAHTGSNIELEDWVAYWKGQVTRACRSCAMGWQSRCWHHRLRSGESYDAKWHYVRNNPVKLKLVDKAEDWPYQGEIFPISWEG